MKRLIKGNGRAGAAIVGCLALLIAFAGPASAQGPGDYVVKGKEASGNSYSGSASLTQTGENTWRIVWRIGSQTWNGFGIGDGKVIAANFSGHGRTGVMLLVTEEGKPGYKSFWAYTGAKEVGSEDWNRR
jgi:hypothetical protein